jgi:ATP-dependent exoDNAse (exonuclease V) beta subunit
LYNDINEVRSKGFSLKDIGILVRDKKKGVIVSKYLLERGINVISSESLLVSSSNDVRLLIYLLKVLSNKNEDINNFILESLRPTPSAEDEISDKLILDEAFEKLEKIEKEIMNIIIPCIIPLISKLKLLYRAKLFALVTISANIMLDGINKKGFANAIKQAVREFQPRFA